MDIHIPIWLIAAFKDVLWVLLGIIIGVIVLVAGICAASKDAIGRGLNL